MASFPGPKVHRVNRRKLGRGQVPALPTASVVATFSTSTVTLTYSEPVVAKLPIGITSSAGGAIISQVQTSPTTVQIVFTSTVSGGTYSVPANSATTLLG